MAEDALHALAREAGLLVDWEDAAGAAKRVAGDSLRAILAAMDLPCADAGEAADSLARLRSAQQADAVSFLTADIGRPIDLPFAARNGMARLRLESGATQDVRVERRAHGARLPPIAEPGYHRLEIDGRELTLAVAPPRATGVQDLAPGRNVWGAAVQVYALRGERPSGFGDFGALAKASTAAAKAGAGALAISPVHALFAADASRFSPYAPSTRLFLNGLYADPSALFPEIDTGGEPDGGDLIDWPTAAPARLQRLRRLYANVRRHCEDDRWRAFEAFRAAGGDDLKGHARFEALHAHFFAETGAPGWQAWPEPFRDKDSPEVEAWARDNAEEVSFHAFLQWLADHGLAAAQAAGRAAGMPVGLIADLAVGMDAGGSHAWSRPHDLLRGLSVGAPPDLFQRDGQDWGIAAFSPQALRRSGFAAFLATLRAAMRHAGGVRIDHAMGLRRLWLTPAGAKASEGAYLIYPFEDMLRLIALESHRARAIVIGEDLGTVPAGFREALDARGIMGMRVLWFERGDGGSFTAPSRWSPQAAALTTTHDLPTLAGWWAGRDIDWAVKLGSEPDAASRRAERAADCTRLWDAARGAGVAHGEPPPPHEPEAAVQAGLAFVASTPCRLALVPTEDLLGEPEQPNLPGDIDRHPNWRRRLPSADIFADPAVTARIARVAEARTRAAAAAVRRVPRATYRLQFHKGFPFAEGAALAPYLAALGVSHVYSSPIGTARAGSNHGYDVVDPTTINPELGGEDGFRALAAALRAHGLGLILDIVPNHMAVGQGDNAWWLDVLEHGRGSYYAGFFDIDWDNSDPALHGKLAAPFLGQPYAEALASGAIRLREVDGRLCAVAHGAHLLPIRPQDRAEVLTAGLSRYDPADEPGRARLHNLLERQHFRLAWWRTANDEINWRRFFDVTELAGLRTEREEVFDAVHALPLRLYAEGLIDGVRVDHVDGLADPAAYCRRLRERLQAVESSRPPGAAPGPAYLVVEKILGPHEALPADWRTDGTTGYDYMNEAAALLHDPAGEAAFTEHWATLSGRPAMFEVEERTARLEMLARSFGSQMRAATRAFHRLARSELATRDLSAGTLGRALTLLLAAFPAYRTYGVGAGPAAGDAAILDTALAHALPFSLEGEQGVLRQVAAWLGGEGHDKGGLRREAMRRFQQLSAPISAKSVEDTAFYRYGRLLSRNDVGSDAGRFAATLAQAHAANAERAASLPDAMLTTATHDHKRGEDVRARLAALSGLPDLWIAASTRWREMNASLAQGVDPADEYQLYQTLLGAWPLDLAADDAAGLKAFGERVAGWQQKALREAKLRSSWAEPGEAYEAACRRLLDGMLDPTRSAAFLRNLVEVVDAVAPAGALNGLVQALLRCLSPGVPDLYQGCEGWDLSLVDPDNRRPVDFGGRQAWLQAGGSPAELLADWRTGAVKAAVIRAALSARARWPEAMALGGYTPIPVTGPRAANVFAFARRHGEGAVVAVAPVRCAEAVRSAARPMLAPDWWGDTALVIPPDLGGVREDLLTGARISAASPRLHDLLADFPLALLSVTRG